MQLRLRRHQLLFRVLVTVAGWTVVAACALELQSGIGHLGITTAVLAATVVITRLLAFPLTRLGGVGRVSLDMALYVAGIATLGAIPVVPVVALGLAIDTFVRAYRKELPLPRSLLTGAYYGGLTGGTLGSFAMAFGFMGPGVVDDSPELMRLLGYGALVVVAHYAMQAFDHLLSGEPRGETLGRVVRGTFIELLLLPLGGAMALLWEPDSPLGVGLLGITYALVNYGFRRIARQSSQLRRRVAELEALNRSGHLLTSTLDRKEVVKTLLAQVTNIVQHVGAIELSLLADERAEAYRLELRPSLQRNVEGEGGKFPDGELQHHELELVEAEALAKLTVPLLTTRRVVVPLTVRDEPRGALVIEGTDAARYSIDTLRLIDGLAVQGATALENARLYELANFDGLTGLYVRRYFDRRIAEETERARRFGAPFAVVMLDIDNFKKLNDSRGHLAGDRVLRAVSLAATTHLRGIDLAARYGGEELAFLLPRTSLADAHAVAERIRQRIEALALPDGEMLIRVTASLGVAAWSTSGSDDPASLVARADAALYRAKGLGKNRVEVDLGGFEMTPSLAPVRLRVAP